MVSGAETRLRAELTTLARSREEVAGALRRAQGAKAELEDEQARLEEENAALHARVRELEEASSADAGSKK